MSLIDSLNYVMGIEPDRTIVRLSIGITTGMIGGILLILVAVYFVNIQNQALSSGSPNLFLQVEFLRNISIFLFVTFILMIGSISYYILLPWRKATE